MPSPTNCLVIFDCDGVLVDGEGLAEAIDVKAIGALGWPITEAHLGRPVPTGWEEEWDAEYRRVFDEQLEAVPGIAEAIRVIAAEGFQTCVASSGSHAKMRRTLGKTGLWDFFDGRIFSASQVEDSQHGVAAAKAADMKAIGFAGGITPVAHLAAADLVITSMSDLPDAVSLLLSRP